jgi:REP element-mobilizing transposase RayT
MFHLARSFAIEINAYAIMSNHFHLVIYYDPNESSRWSDEEVAFRWVEAFPPAFNGQVLEDLKPLCREQMLSNKSVLNARRKKLGCLSTFMKHLKQPIARRANKEDGCKGHFFETRFYSGALLSEEALLAAMSYVDLNPVRARIARSIEQCQNTSIHLRIKHLENTLERLKEIIEPVVSGINKTTHRFQITLSDYIEQLNVIIRIESGVTTSGLSNKQRRWFAQVNSIRKRQRAYGPIEALAEWTMSRGMKRPGIDLPA